MHKKIPGAGRRAAGMAKPARFDSVKLHKKPLISVIMAVWNDRPEFVCQSVESVLRQTYGRFELLIMDDSSREDTKAAVDRYRKDSRVRIYRPEKRLGFVPSLNRGLDIARGDYIARMDADDVARPGRFEKQVKYLISHPQTDILGGQIRIINEKSQITGSRFYPLGGLQLAVFFCVRTPVAHPAVMFRKSIADAGYRYDESLKKAEDIDFWLRLYRDGYKIENLADVILDFRTEAGFMEKRVMNKEQEHYVLKIRRRYFSMRKPLFSAANWFCSCIRQCVPDSFKTRIYLRENGEGK